MEECYHFNARDTVPKDVRELSDLFPLQCIDCREIIRYDKNDHKPTSDLMDYVLAGLEVKDALLYRKRWI